jgi:GH15 family glucan-1,4-alpha-glucosidase
MLDLYRFSIEVILNNQAKSGAYIASPNFPTYHYCWFRDASFIAYAMDLASESWSAVKFHNWAARVILNRTALVQRAISKAQDGIPPAPEDQLHTRYTMEGEDGTREEWPNYQLDGLGTWLWALNEHLQITNQKISDEWLLAAQLVGQYLEALWQTPCFDCWEEFPEDIHSYTLASIYGGLQALSRLDGVERYMILSKMREFMAHNGVHDGFFIKKVGSYTVDASLLGLAVPFKIVDIHDPRFEATLQRIETSLIKGGGVHRYPTDTYYGGGEWILLGGWLGWVYALCGQTERARELLQWIESNADEEGNLPEQVPVTLNGPNYYLPWLRQWGPIARPLLWSHAKYIILKKHLPPTLI